MTKEGGGGQKGGGRGRDRWREGETVRRWGSDRVPPRVRGGTGDQEGKMRVGRNKKADAIQLQETE